jgi:MFS family permease
MKETYHQPWQFSSIQGRWASLFIVSIACVISMGPVMSWPTLEPLMQAQGIFKSRGESVETTNSLYSEVYQLSNIVMFLASLPSGLLFDAVGGRASGLIGAFGTSLGLLLMAIAAFDAKEYDYLLFIGYPMATAFGMLNTNALYTFIWLIPEDQNFISGVISGVTALADMLALIAVFLHDKFNLPISSYFMSFSLLSILSSGIFFFFVPDRGLEKHAKDVILKELIEAGAEETAPSDIHKAPQGVFTKISRAWRELYKYFTISILVIVFSSVYFVAIIYPFQVMLPYYKAIWPSNSLENGTAVTLVNVFAVVYGCGGFVSALAVTQTLLQTLRHNII